MAKQMSPVHLERMRREHEAEVRDAKMVPVRLDPNTGVWWTYDERWSFEYSDQHWRTCEPHPGCDGHDVQFGVWTVGDERTGCMAGWCEGYTTLRGARAALYRNASEEERMSIFESQLHDEINRLGRKRP